MYEIYSGYQTVPIEPLVLNVAHILREYRARKPCTETKTRILLLFCALTHGSVPHHGIHGDPVQASRMASSAQNARRRRSNDQSLAITEIKPRDGQELALFFQQNDTPMVTHAFNPFPLTDESARRIACNREQDRFYIARFHRELVGFGMLRGFQAGYALPSLGILIGVPYQGRGFGRRLIEEVVRATSMLGCDGVRLSVYNWNRRAIRLYESLGFVAEADGDELNPNRIIMTKRWI